MTKNDRLLYNLKHTINNTINEGTREKNISSKMTSHPKLISRQKDLKELEDFINTTQASIKSVVEELGWDFSALSDDKKMATCSVNAAHLMPVESLEKHEGICKMKSKGYSEEEIDSIPPSSAFIYENSSAVVSALIDKETQNKVLLEAANNGQLGTGIRHSVFSADVPLTTERYITTFAPNERLALYEHVVKQAREAKRHSAISLEDLAVNFEENANDDEKPKSHIELLAEQRDYKRRRQTYRAKNVHITKKSYTEVMREVIENQVKFLEHLKKEDDKQNEERSESMESRDLRKEDDRHRHSERHHKKSRHGSPSSHHSRSSSHYRSSRRDDKYNERRSHSKKHRRRHRSSDKDA